MAGSEMEMIGTKQPGRPSNSSDYPPSARTGAETDIGLANLVRRIHLPQKKLDGYTHWQAIQTQAFYCHSERVFMRHSCRFARVAMPASHRDIVDRVGAPSRKRYHMVDCPFTPRKFNTAIAAFAICYPQGLQFTASYNTWRLIFAGSPVCGSRSLIKPIMRRQSSIPPLSVSVHDTIVPRFSLKALVYGPIDPRYAPTQAISPAHSVPAGLRRPTLIRLRW